MTTLLMRTWVHSGSEASSASVTVPPSLKVGPGHGKALGLPASTTGPASLPASTPASVVEPASVPASMPASSHTPVQPSSPPSRGGRLGHAVQVNEPARNITRPSRAAHWIVRTFICASPLPSARKAAALYSAPPLTSKATRGEAMKAVAFEKHGDESVLQLREVPDPKVGAKDVLVRVKACALNHLDIWVRQGWQGLKLEMPHILGSDVAGVVERVGPEVTDLAPGAEVLVNPGLSCGHCEQCLLGNDPLCRSYRILGEHARGGYAERVSVPRQNILPKPKNLTFEQAACVPLTFLTSWTMLTRRANLQPGETILVHAAGSGVGSAAIQMAKLIGAQVIATASTEEKLAKAKELGADHLINYSKVDFLEEVKRLTQRRMVNVVFEHVGEATWAKSIACLPPG